jgi:hypothetical protein
MPAPANDNFMVNFRGDVDPQKKANSRSQNSHGLSGSQSAMNLLQRSRFETLSSLAFFFQVLKAVP